MERGERKTTWMLDNLEYSSIEHTLREHFLKLGFKIQPTGCVGGVIQLTYDIL